mmetsp:Transcript_18358/g.39687  ORF Transcript_18358/g.39687 Transcript_18358/m.39687 type:complete len:439 (-) Transcript_18358:448-1764(-)
MWRTLLIIVALCALHLVTAQPLAGGGGGGGGFNDGGGFGDNDYDTPVCPPHCHSCSVDDVCDVCYGGYKLMYDGSCTPCPPGCKKCDVYGPFKCDECADRHVLVLPWLHRRCERCSDHCKRCDDAGPGACDDGQCDWGYVRHPILAVCEACTKHCGICSNTSDSGCLKCKTFYRLAEGSCALDMAFLAKIFVTVAIILSTYRYMRRRIGSDNQLMPLSTHETFVAESDLSRSSAEEISQRLLPSGVWRGFYTHSGARHDVCEFSLEFRPDGSATGGGVDDVGEYTISGLCNNTASRLAFTKTYIGRSPNVSGVVSYGNQGHSVEYRGELVTGVGGALGGGFRGEWAIRHAIGNENGTFHLWPAMEGWQDPETEFDTEPQRTYEVESECVVCFDRPITTSLRPCGHQVLCRECADQLRSPPTCPICRAKITLISNCSAS